MGFMGGVGLFGQLLLIKALGVATSSLLAPFAYTQIIWATLIGMFVFGDIPELFTIVGVAIIILGGLLVTRSSTNLE